MKKMIKLFIPPISHILFSWVKSSILRLRHSGQEIGYEQSEIINLVIWKNKIFRSSRVRGSISSSSLGSILGVLLASTHTDSLKVIDFGGGGGSLRELACSAKRDLNLEWVVVETPEMVKEARLELQEDWIKYESSVLEASTRLSSVDLIIASGSLQYTQKPLETLLSLTELGSEYVYITRTPLSNDGNSIEYTQESFLASNGPGDSLPRNFKNRIVRYVNTIVPKSEFEKILSLNYKIVLHIDEGLWDESKFGNLVSTNGYYCAKLK